MLALMLIFIMFQWYDLHVDFNNGAETGLFVSLSSPSDWLHVPLMLRFGDFNLDGYPDALVTLQLEKYVGQQMFVHLLFSFTF